MVVRRLWRDEHRALTVSGYLTAHSGEHLNVRGVSRELAMSESTLRRTLKTAWGVGFHVILERVRVQRALEMLVADPGTKMEAVALNAGWRSRGTLYECTFRVTGHSLTVLRANDTLLREDLRRLSARNATGALRDASRSA